jgi:hypothetical protein
VEFIPIKHLKSTGGGVGRSLEDWERALLQKVLSFATGAAPRAGGAVGGSGSTYFERNGFVISPQRR